MTELSGLYSAQDAMSHAVVGQCAEARREAAAAIRLSRDNFTLESAGRALAWCGADADASNLSGELARRFPDAILTTHVILPVMAAATAIRSGQPGACPGIARAGEAASIMRRSRNSGRRT